METWLDEHEPNALRALRQRSSAPGTQSRRSDNLQLKTISICAFKAATMGTTVDHKMYLERSWLQAFSVIVQLEYCEEVKMSNSTFVNAAMTP